MLEVGFGGGYLLGRMIPVVTSGLVAGLDFSSTMAACCAGRYRTMIQAGRVELVYGQAEALPYPAGYFTKAVTVNSIFYWDEAPLAIAELARVLAIEGLLVLCFTAREDLVRKGFTRHGLTLYEPAEVEQLMRRAGLGQVNLVRAADKYRQFWCLVGQK